VRAAGSVQRPRTAKSLRYVPQASVNWARKIVFVIEGMMPPEPVFLLPTSNWPRLAGLTPDSPPRGAYLWLTLPAVVGLPSGPYALAIMTAHARNARGQS